MILIIIILVDDDEDYGNIDGGSNQRQIRILELV